MGLLTGTLVTLIALIAAGNAIQDRPPRETLRASGLLLGAVVLLVGLAGLVVRLES